MPELSRKALEISQSEIRLMSIECERVGGINMAQGVCDTEVPLPVRRGAHESIEFGANQYTRLDGISSLRNAIAQKMLRYNRIPCDPETEILVTAGSTGAFLCACLTLLQTGDEVILFEPYYGYHVHTLEMLGIVPRFITLQPPAWTYPISALENAITSRTRAIVINTPANPSGKVFQQEELATISKLANKHDLFVITDEIYEYFVYDGREHVSPATIPGLRDRTITISGFSKIFSVTGWRVGYSVASPQWTSAMKYFSDLAYICAPSPLQHGAAYGLNELGDDFYLAVKNEYALKRQMICDTLREVGLTPYEPQGSYYVLADASPLPGNNSKERAMFLLEQTGVATVPGEAFVQRGGETMLRFCFAKKMPDLEEACRRLRKLSGNPSLAHTPRSLWMTCGEDDLPT